MTLNKFWRGFVQSSLDATKALCFLSPRPNNIKYNIIIISVMIITDLADSFNSHLISTRENLTNKIVNLRVLLSSNTHSEIIKIPFFKKPTDSEEVFEKLTDNWARPNL